MPAMQQPTVGRVTLLALGLIGGSLAKALREANFCREIVAWGHREPSLRRGRELGAIDAYSLDLAEAVAGADIVVIATPTLVAETVLQELVPLVNTDCVITDVASVKGNLLRAARKAFGDVPPNLVLAHPIAGSERSGVEAARADLFINHRVILTPTDETATDATARVRSMWEATGADVVSMGVEEHDRVLAATSHLPHMLAYALVDTLIARPDGEAVFRFAAGGFRDFTRIASSDPKMWHDIALANRPALLEAIDDFSAGLGRLREAIDAADGAAIMACFERAKAARDRFAELLAKQNQTTTSQE